MRLTTLLAATLLLAGATGNAAAQDSVPAGTLAGRVIDRLSGSPVADAEIRVAETDLRAVSDVRGEFRIPRVPAGTRTVRVRLLGYRLREQPVTIPAGTVTRVEVALEEAALPLDEVVVTATRRDQRLADVPITTEVLRREDI